MPDDVTGKRAAPISYRPPKALEANFLRRVERSGLSTSAFITKCIFDRDPPRQSRRPPVEKQDLARLLARCAQISDKLHEVALAQGEDSAASSILESVHGELTTIRAAVMSALGRAP